MDTQTLILLLAVAGAGLGIGFLWGRQGQSALSALLDAARAETETSKAALAASDDRSRTAEQAVARLEAEKAAQDAQIARHAADLADMQQKMTLQFENLANRIFEEKTTKFKQDSADGLGQLLSPLKDRLQAFEKRVEESFGKHATEQFSLKTEIARIVLENEKIVTQTKHLTDALKGDSKVQGNWGETVLEKILEASGLREGTDYTRQGEGMKLSSDDGARLQPDIVVNLPESKHIVVDSKVSLTHYERFFAATDDGERTANLRLFLASVKKHVDELAAKNYTAASGLNAPDFVLMFIPIEGAYAMALQEDQNLQSYAWDRRIVIVCPATLFATLRTVASVWRIEQQNRNTAEIARQGGLLYDEIAAFIETMQNVGEKIKGVQKAYDTAMEKLSTKRGNLLKRSADLQKLGVKTKKSIPAALLDETPDDDGDDTKLDEKAA